MDSVIYSGLNPEVAAQCGYFSPKAEFSLLDKSWCRYNSQIKQWTQVIYFPGSFGTFHEGHVSICRAALEKYPGAVLVIAPANSDYTVEKYGAWSERASNKHRYDAIKRAMPEAIIDIEPMLNLNCDHNFTDLLENFLDSHNLTLFNMKHKPVILCGKDRDDFLELNKHTDHIIVEHFDDTTGASTSALENKLRGKKNLMLRCSNKAEFYLFQKYFFNQYRSFIPVLLDDELAIAKLYAESCTHTICKEYAHLLPYIKLSRTFTNPLEDPTFPDRDERIQPGMTILDSDIYSGSTRNFVVDRCGASMMALWNFEKDHDYYELLDIDDFRKPDFCYPHVDISSRCSMQAFDFDFHKRFNEFKEKLSCLK